MALNIENSKTEALAIELAAIKRKPITQAVHDAIVREMRYEKSLNQKLPRADFMEKISEMQDRIAKLPILDSRHPDDILYDEFGLPK
jgi:hypothetical protein